MGRPKLARVSISASAAWDAEYAAGRYHGEPPVRFVTDIVDTARHLGLSHGLYVGCGNGRNLLPMLDAGLDLVGLDISAEAIGQLRRNRPDRAGRLVVGDLSALSPSAVYELVIGIQVFQHGSRALAHEHVRAAVGHVGPGGLLCVRVNAAATDVEHEHDRIEENGDGSYTVRYRAGPKAGLDIHFFSAAELSTLVGDRFAELIPPRLQSTPRISADRGQWSQWEAIWQRGPAVRAHRLVSPV